MNKMTEERQIVIPGEIIAEGENTLPGENTEKTLLEKQITEESFNDPEKWEELVWDLTRVNLEDSIVIWVSQQQNIFVKTPALQNTTEDNFVGLRNYLNVRKAEIQGNDTIKIGLPETYLEENSWIPLVLNGINMMDITNTIHDPGIWSEPKTLKKEGFRLNFEIESTEGTEINVPEDSFIWNVEEKKWSTVAEGTTAKTKVSYDLSNYIGAKWHHGVEIGWSDILFFTASLWDRSFDKEKLATENFETWQDLFNETTTIKINGNILEVYLNKSSFETGQLTGFAGALQRFAPWEIYAGADELVFEDKTFSYSKEPDKETKPLSLVNEEHVLELINTLKAMDFQKIKPMVELAGKEYATEEEFNARIIALENWFDEKGHLIISDGPFYLNKYNSVTGELELNAFRDESYPINWKQWE